MDMTKKAFSVLLALVLLFSAAPLVCASPDEEGWLIYYERADERTFDAIIVAPAKYTRVSDCPQIETIDAAKDDERSVLVPETEQITFRFDGKTETHWTMKVTCTVSDGSFLGYSLTCAVLPGSVLDSVGNGNARIWFDDDVEYREAKGFAEIDVSSALLQRDYSRDDATVAVGDTLRVDYSGLYPVEILINGEAVTAFPGGEMQRYTYSVTDPGALDVAVRQNGETVETRSMAVITSQEMYRRNLRDGLVTAEDIPSAEDFIEVSGSPIIPFIPFFQVVAFFVLLREFFFRLFSFPRITK